MLTIQDLIEINYIPQEAEISLELFVNFYEQYSALKGKFVL